MVNTKEGKSMNSKWKMNLFGLVDFWYYDNQVFKFADGHMLLRGSNGTGKSVTLQSILPLLLDGNKSNNRIDPFGTNARKIENYLLDENSERNERIGYLYLEFKKQDIDMYVTIGMGLRARKNKPLETWYFVIEDNKRIEHDIQLIDEGYTLTKKQLEKVIGQNQIYDRQQDYMQKVNKTLFGFDTLEQYKEAIEILLQVRRPKLGNEFKPTIVKEILNNSLPALSEDDLRPMSDAITAMDEIKDYLDRLNDSIRAAELIEKEYDFHCYYSIFKKYELYENESKKYNQIIKEIEQLEIDKIDLSNQIDEYEI